MKSTPLFNGYLPWFMLFFILVTSCSPEPKIKFNKGDRIALIGNALAERMQYHGYLETYLQASQPGKQLVVRNLGFTGDQVAHRPRAHEDYGDADTHLTNVKANRIFAFFGYNESFEDVPGKFRDQLLDWIDHTREQKYDGESTPGIVLFSPIAHEDLNNPNLPSGEENNQRLQEYTQAMAEVAKEKEVAFVNLFEGTKALYEQSEEPLTINGVHLNQKGNKQVAQLITRQLIGYVPDLEEEKQKELRQAVLDKNWHWFNRYRATDGNDVWGSRAKLHGNRETLQRELEMLEVMTQNRDQLIWDIAQGNERQAVESDLTIDELWGAQNANLGVDDSNVPDPVKVKTNFEQEVEYLGPKEAMEKMHLADGLKVNLFASEERFPEIANPVATKVDTKGRLWVAAWKTYPKWEPMKKMEDKLVILTDNDGDGVADESKTFAKIHNPTGFEFWNGGVIVVSAPNILFLKDTDGDDVADKRVVLFGGIDSADTHHTANNLVYGPDGWIYYQRGVFMLSNVETPWRGNFESDKPGLYRFNPRTFEFDFHTDNSPNPHGISFDKWGYQYITDGTSGRAYQVYLDENSFDISDFQYFKKRKLLEKTVRPVPGNQVLSSNHFPEEYENNFLIYNVIGFLGIKRYELEYNDGVVQGEELPDLIYSDDPNFRPTSGVVGSDGALYISDWHNPLIGHMQHNIRDPKRDHKHGRIYRITAEGRPLQEPVSIHGEPIEHLLELLKHPVNGVRHRVRIELSGRDTKEVISEAQAWVKQFDPSKKEEAHTMLEILWLHQQHNVENRELLKQLLESPVEHANIAARRVQWFWDNQEATHSEGMASSEGQNESADNGKSNEKTEEEESGKIVDLTDQEVATVTVKAVPEKLLYDTKEITVKAGQQVKLTLKNPDAMQHNLVIVNPGTADKVAEKAQKLGSEGFDKQFIPESPNILHATDLLDINEEQTLEFTAPSEPGEYQFVCTFPGHAQSMRGIIKVIKD